MDFNQRKRAEREAALERAANMPKRERALLFSGEVDQVWTCSCPACSGTAALGGEQTEEEVLSTSYEEYNAWETVRRYFSADELHCPACGLNLDGVDELEAAKVETDYDLEEEREMRYEREYDNE